MQLKLAILPLLVFLLGCPLSEQTEPLPEPRESPSEQTEGEISSEAFEPGEALAETGQPLRVLFLGNSYTEWNNLPRVIEALAQSPQSSLQLETRGVTRGGARWETHATSTASLAMIDRGWDVVVLQDQSRQPVLAPLTLKSAADTLDKRIRAAGGKTMLFMTWPRAFHDLTTQHYYPLYYNRHGEHLGAQVAPVGQAWARSLRLAPKLRLHTEDDSHPNAHGTYLAACVFFASLTGQSPLGLPDGGLNLSMTDRKFLQTVAWDTVRSTGSVGGTPPPTEPLSVHRRLDARAVEDHFVSPGLKSGDMEGPLGVPRTGTHFDGTQFVSIPWTPALLPPAHFTLGVWAWRSNWATPTESREFLIENPSTFSLYQKGSLLHASVRTLSSGDVLTTFNVAGLTPGWHHLAVTYDGAEVVLWLDGLGVTSSPATGDLDPGSANLAFSSLVLGARGSYPGPTEASEGFTKGALADFRLLHRALDEGEISELWNLQ